MTDWPKDRRPGVGRAKLYESSAFDALERLTIPFQGMQNTILSSGARQKAESTEDHTIDLPFGQKGITMPKNANPAGIARTDRRIEPVSVTIATVGGEQVRIVEYPSLRGDKALRFEGPTGEATYYPKRGVVYCHGHRWDAPKGRKNLSAAKAKELHDLIAGMVAL